MVCLHSVPPGGVHSPAQSRLISKSALFTKSKKDSKTDSLDSKEASQLNLTPMKELPQDFPSNPASSTKNLTSTPMPNQALSRNMPMLSTVAPINAQNVPSLSFANLADYKYVNASASTSQALISSTTLATQANLSPQNLDISNKIASEASPKLNIVTQLVYEDITPPETPFTSEDSIEELKKDLSGELNEVEFTKDNKILSPLKPSSDLEVIDAKVKQTELNMVSSEISNSLSENAINLAPSTISTVKTSITTNRLNVSSLPLPVCNASTHSKFTPSIISGTLTQPAVKPTLIFPKVSQDTSSNKQTANNTPFFTIPATTSPTITTKIITIDPGASIISSSQLPGNSSTIVPSRTISLTSILNTNQINSFQKSTTNASAFGPVSSFGQNQQPLSSPFVAGSSITKSPSFGLVNTLTSSTSSNSSTTTSSTGLSLFRQVTNVSSSNSLFGQLSSVPSTCASTIQPSNTLKVIPVTIVSSQDDKAIITSTSSMLPVTSAPPIIINMSTPSALPQITLKNDTPPTLIAQDTTTEIQAKPEDLTVSTESSALNLSTQPTLFTPKSTSLNTQSTVSDISKSPNITNTKTLFSQASNNTTSSFGQNTTTTSIPLIDEPADIPKSTLFGQMTSTTSIFGQTTVSTASSGFGTASVTSTTTTTPLFTQPSTTTTTAPLLFGQTAITTANSAFGSRTSVFGQKSDTTSSFFGQPVSTQSSFFPKSTSDSVFGQVTTQTSPFQQVPPNTTSPFNQGANVFFSQQTTGTAPLFGGNQASTNSSVFGNQSAASGFSFGKSTFGQGDGSFGLAKSVFGQQTTSTFGQSSTNNSAFGQASTNNLFGQSTFFSGLGGKPNADKDAKNVFGATNLNKSNTSSSIFGNEGASVFGGKTGGSFSGSFSSTGGSVAQSGFGAFQQTSQKTGGFGAAPSFGGSPAFGSPPAFGSSSTFGSSNPLGSSLFGGQQSSTFSNFASASSPTFGSLASQSGVFGQSQQPVGFGQQQSSPFGAAPVFGGSSFGGQQSSFGSPGSQSNSSAFTQWRN